jgi:hypothetical protein
VAEDDQRARPLLGDVHANAVRFDGAVLDLAHMLSGAAIDCGDLGEEGGASPSSGSG